MSSFFSAQSSETFFQIGLKDILVSYVLANSKGDAHLFTAVVHDCN